MNIVEQQEKGKELYQKLIQKTWKDNTFKERLISSPNEILEEEFGIKFDNKVFVEDQTNNNFIYLNIPKKIELENLELTDEQLESVSGGEGGAAIVTWLVVVAVGGALWDMSGGAYRRLNEEFD